MSLSHFNKKNKDLEMVDISSKKKTKRKAVASGLIIIDKNLHEYLSNEKKIFNNLLNAAKISGILGGKSTSTLIPLTHNIPIDYLDIKMRLVKNNGIEIISEARSHYSTGIEIEAILSVSIAAVTIYDMLKSYKKDIVIKDIKLLKKSGGIKK